MEVAAADQQPEEHKNICLKQAARYYEQGMVIVLTGIPDEEQAEELLTRCLELYQQIQDERSGERARQWYKKLVKQAREATK